MDYVIAGIAACFVRLPDLRAASSGAVLRVGDLPGILQMIVYFVVLLLLDQTAGRLYGQAVRGRAHVSASGPAAAGSLLYSLSGVQRRRGTALDAIRGIAARFSIFGFLFVYLMQRAQAYLPFNPQNFGTPG